MCIYKHNYSWACTGVKIANSTEGYYPYHMGFVINGTSNKKKALFRAQKIERSCSLANGGISHKSSEQSTCS